MAAQDIPVLITEPMVMLPYVEKGLFFEDVINIRYFG